ncbi:MAG: hypothetical protein DLM64_05985, partial [Solirubrobacterales bacterium]
VMILAGSLVLPAFDAAAHKRVSPPPPASGGPQTTWAPVGSVPFSDATAAALVAHQAESRPDNSAANDYVPTDAQLGAFQSSLDAYGETPARYNPLYRYVTGRPGLSNPSTDDLIQWAAHKWGIPEDVIRAQMAVESWWHQSQLGDRTTVSSSWYGLYPVQAQIAGTSDVYESMGVMQVRWHADDSLSAGTEPLRWQSTAFNLDYYAASIRYYYDGYCSWCSAGYTAGQAWSSIGAWYEPSPWANADAQSYVQHVQADLTGRVWAQPGF